MSNGFDSTITYFRSEGRENVRSCVRLALDRAKTRGIKSVTIFTAEGDGVAYALDLLERSDRLAQVRLVCVTFPPDRSFSKFPDLKFKAEHKDRITAAGVKIVDGWQPFDLPTREQAEENPELKSEREKKWRWRKALSILSAGVPLAVESALMTCDAGLIDEKMNIITVTASTALLVRTCKTENFPDQFIIREIICKPAILDISKKESRPDPQADD